MRVVTQANLKRSVLPLWILPLRMMTPWTIRNVAVMRAFPDPRRSWFRTLCFVQRLCALQLSRKHAEFMYYAIPSELKCRGGADASHLGRIPLQPDTLTEGARLDSRSSCKSNEPNTSENLVLLVSLRKWTPGISEAETQNVRATWPDLGVFPRLISVS